MSKLPAFSPMSAEELAKQSVPDLSSYYNGIAIELGKPTVVRFRDREAAMKRIDDITAERIAASGGKVAPDPAATKPTSTQVDTPAPKGGKGKGKAPEAPPAAPPAAPATPAPTKKGGKGKGSTEAPPAAPATTAPKTTNLVGKTSAIAGHKLFAIKDANTRKAGSFGWHSMKIIFDKPGITYEDFIKAGGRAVDVKWDIEHGNVRTEAPKA